MYVRKLNKATDHRLALLKNLVRFLLQKGKIQTTFARAKEVGVLTEKIITKSKCNTLHNRRNVLAFLDDETVVSSLFSEIAPKFSQRNGGYTRINKLGPRRGDAAEMALIELMPV
ncbi:MAG: 50S ribosomal protein L17 [Oscillospiraceae bacterium]|jgi:large subunit ribosomal protein L17|nr:50S ribosomal protein L17 [Oscillospiraceae bacterium]